MVVNEENAANAFELIEAHNRQLIGEIGSPDFDGDTKLDPTLNNGERYIHAADEVIRYLARPGVAFSVHNACAQVLRGSSAANRWLYLWCHRHERQLRDCVDIIRS